MRAAERSLNIMKIKGHLLLMLIWLFFSQASGAETGANEPNAFSTEWELTNNGDVVSPKITIISPRQLVNPRLNGFLLAGEMLTGTTITIDANGKGTYHYENILPAVDLGGIQRAIVDAYSFPFQNYHFKQVYHWARTAVSGEVVYKFQSAYPFTSFQWSPVAEE